MSTADRLNTLITGLIDNGTFVVNVEGIWSDSKYKTDVPNVKFSWLINRLRDIEAQARREEANV